MAIHPAASLSRVLALAVVLGCSSSKEGDDVVESVEVPAGPEDSVTIPPLKASSTGSAQPTAVTIGPPSASGTSIVQYDPTGPNPVDRTKLKGDAKTCDTVMACCDKQQGPLALLCQTEIAQQNGDCAKILETVKKFVADIGEKPPACQ